MEDEREESGSDSEGEAEDVVAGLEKAVQADPSNYEAHERYIEALRKAGDLDKLRAARELMSSLFPLTGKMWLDWTRDEARIMNSDRPEEVAAVEALYERGVNDYLHVPLWVEYLEFVKEHDPGVRACTPEGLSRLREICERALVSAGLHMAEGMKVWEAYRDFEQSVLDAAPEEEKQVDRVRSLFHRQLAVPLLNHASTLQAYKDWESEQGGHESNDMDSNVLKPYKRAAQLCEDFKVFEDSVEATKPADADLLQNYLIYIAAEEAKSDPARVQLLFERAVSVFPVTPDLWFKYCSYVDKLKVPTVCKSVYRRAVRYCPWVGDLWRRYMLALERCSSSEEEISAVFEESLGKGFQTPDEYLGVFLTRADGLRRRMPPAGNEAERQVLRDVFQRGASLVSHYFPEFVDRSLQLHSYWAQLELRLFNDLEAARGVWESLIKSSGWMTEVWQGYIGMELGLSHAEQVRSLYRRCYSKKLEGNGTEIMCQAWLRFEREYGSLQDLDNAAAKAGQKLEEVRSLGWKMAQREKAKGTTEPPDEQPESGSAKRKRDKDVKVEKKRQRKQEPVPEPKPPKSESVDQDKNENVHQEEPRRPVRNDQLTVFVSNIALDVTAEELENFFASCGGLKEVRLVKDKYTQQSRGFAYVEFESDENVAAAVDKNKTKMRDKKLSIARSNPKSGRREKSNEDFRKMFLRKRCVQ